MSNVKHLKSRTLCVRQSGAPDSVGSLIFCKDKIFSYICDNYNEKLTPKFVEIMKRLVAIFAVVVLSMTTVLPASAQEYQLPRQTYETRADIGVGWVSIPDVVGILVTGLGSLDFEGDTFVTSFTPCTNPSIEVMRYKNEWFSYGLSVTIGLAEGTIEAETGVVKKQTKCFYPTLSFVAETRYFKDENFALYGSWGVGASFYMVRQKYTNGYGDSTFDVAVLPCVDIYPLCARWGEQIGVYAALGAGSKGGLNVGGFINF